MERILPRFVPITLIAICMAASCSKEAELPLDPGLLSEYEDLTQKDHVLLNLESAYEDMNVDECRRLLDDKFTFFFSQTNYDSGLVDTLSWGMSSEEAATSNMFGRRPSKDGGMVIDRINLVLNYAPGEDAWVLDPGAPGNHEGEDRYERTVRYDMAVTANGGRASFACSDIVALFVIKKVVVDGLTVWKIFTWRDDITIDPKRPDIHDQTWGQLKSMFYQPGGTPMAQPSSATSP